MVARALLTLTLLAATPAATAPPPVWPLALDTRFLTSNFMERRPGRYHAGLDFKTNSSTGYVVRAVEDGWISRVRAEAGAYGRAVYLRGDSGRTTVYAHLAYFSDRIRERVDADRDRSGRYRVRLELQPGELPVRAGETLGLSGQSGTNGPHLHFEVRDEQQRPLDPLAWGFAVPDTFPPLITSVTAHPVRPGPHTHRQGTDVGAAPVARTVHSATGLAGALDTLRIAGPVAFSAGITEYNDVHGHRLEPWLIEVRLDGESVYRRCNERFAFSASSTLRLEWCEVTGRDGEVLIREQWLHRRDGVGVPGREGGAWYLGQDGGGLAPGVHRLEILAADRAGGKSSVVVPLQVWRPASQAAVAVGWTPAAAEVRSAAGDRLTPFFAEYRAGLGSLVVLKLTPQAGDPVLAPTVLWCENVAADETGPSAPGLEPLPWRARYLAADWPLDGALRVAAAGVPAAADAWIFRLSGNAWRPVGPLQRDADGAAWFHLDDPGLHAAFRDVTAPWIDPTPLSVAARAVRELPGVTLPRWQTVPVAIVDRGTGVDAATIGAVFDGEPMIVEPDVVRDRVLVTIPDATSPGAHKLVLEAADRAGNRFSRSLAVEVR